MALRKLINEISWQVDKGPLHESQAVTDDYLESVNDGIGIQDDFGEQIGETGEVAVGAYGDAGDAIDEFGDITGDALEETAGQADMAGDSISALGDEGAAAGDELTDSFGEATEVLDEMGDVGATSLGGLQAGIAGVIGTGFGAYLWDAAAALEMAEMRMTFFVDEAAGDMEVLNEAIADTIDMSRGIHRRADLLKAAHQASIYQMEVTQIADVMDDLAVVSAATGTDIERMFFGVGRAIDSGTVRMLERMGISFRDEMYAMEDQLGKTFRQWDRARRELFVLEQVQDRAAQMQSKYNDYVETGEARMTAFRGAVGDIAEIMGEPLIGPVATFTETFRDMIDTIQADPVGEFVLTLGGWATGLGIAGIAAYGLGKGLKWAVGILFGSFLPGLWSAIGAAAPWVLAIGGVILILQDLVGALWGVEDTVTETVFNMVSEWLGFETRFHDVQLGFHTALARIRGNISDLVDDIVGAATDSEHWLGDIFQGFVTFSEGMIWTPLEAFRLMISFLRGDWETFDEAMEGLTKNLGKIWGDFWGNIIPDSVSQGFSNAIEGIKGARDDMADAVSDTLSGIRDFLPFSPAREGPLVDLKDAGAGIVEEINYGIQMAPELDFAAATAGAETSPSRQPAYQTPRGETGTRTGSLQASVNIGKVEVHAGPGADGDEIARTVSRELKRQLPDMVNDLFRKLRSKMQRALGR